MVSSVALLDIATIVAVEEASLACSGVGAAIVRWEIPLWPGENGAQPGAPRPIPMPDPSHEHARAPWIDRARSRLLAAYPPPGADGFSSTLRCLDLFHRRM